MSELAATRQVLEIPKDKLLKIYRKIQTLGPKILVVKRGEHGAMLLSPDGVAWKLAPNAKAWSRTIAWDDGTTSTQANIERPFVLFRDGLPAWLFAATADGPGPRDGHPGHYFAESTWSMVFPLKP